MGGINATCINDVEIRIIPFSLGYQAVARGARDIIHNGEAFPARRLKSLLLPTLGRPTKATTGLGIIFQIYLYGKRWGYWVGVGVIGSVEVGVGVEAVSSVMVASTVPGRMD